MGWQIVKHSFLMLWRNLSDALKVSVGPVVIAVLVSGIALTVSGITPEMVVFGMTTGELPASAMLGVLFVLLVMVFAFAWIAVSWHRFVLLEEYPGLLPSIGNRPIWPYAGMSILLAMAMLLALLPALFVAAMIGNIAGQGAVVSALLGIAVGVYFTYLWLRTALVLPALSVGHPLKISEAWRITGQLSAPILQAAAIVVTINVLGSSLIGAVSGGVIGVVIETTFSWVTLMAGTSVLTTLYGVLIEKRELPV
jgi:hypothetical protein